jgi:hypothetical protein
MRKRRVKLLNNKYIIAYHIKLMKEQRYFSKAKLHDEIFYQLLNNVFIMKLYIYLFLFYIPPKMSSRNPGGTHTPG